MVFLRPRDRERLVESLDGAHEPPFALALK